MRLKISCMFAPISLHCNLQSRTGPEQGFPCVLLPHREKPVFITGVPVDINRFFPVGKSTQGRPCFHYRDGFTVCSKIYLEVCEHFHRSQPSVGRGGGLERFAALARACGVENRARKTNSK